jgi:hypothetical protein
MAEKSAKSKTSAAKTPDKIPLTPDILEKEIRAAAQKVFEQRKERHLDGDALSDWLKAEVEVKKKHKLI